MPIGTAEELSELRKQVEELQEWREDVQQQAEFMAQMTASARSKRAARMRLLGYGLATLTVVVQLAVAVHIFVAGH